MWICKYLIPIKMKSSLFAEAFICTQSQGFKKNGLPVLLRHTFSNVVSPRNGSPKPGFVGTLKGARPGRTLLLRADMDALPIQEETGLPFDSVIPGVMHACGHDGHTSILLVAAKILSGMTDKFSGTIKFVFQPNEEDGASYMIQEGVLEDPKVDAAFALHL